MLSALGSGLRSGRGLAVLAALSVATGLTAVLWGPQHRIAFVLLCQVTVVVTAVQWGRWPATVASALSVLAYDYFMETPAYTLAVANWHSLAAFVGLMTLAQLVAGLMQRLRTEAEQAQARERETEALYTLARDLGQADDPASVAQASLSRLLGVPVRLVLLGPGETPPVVHPAGAALAEVELRALRRGRPVHGLVPLRAGGVLLGALLLDPELCPPGLLEAFATQTALALERARLRREAELARLETARERMVSSLLSSVSHDLRTPLATIRGAAATLAMEWPEAENPARADLLRLLAGESDRLARLVENLLDMTRLEGAAPQLRKVWQSLEELLGAALARLEARVGRVQVEVRIPEDLPLVPLDEVLMEHLILNLLENAFRHAPGSLVQVEAEASEGWVELRVRDSGPGVPEAFREKVFEKFVRAPSARASDGGAGLGLAICRAVAEAHGGRIWVDGAPGGGACFHVTLPWTPLPGGEDEES